MTPINIKENNQAYKLLGGNYPNKVLDEDPFEIYHQDVIYFLNKLSKELLKNNQLLTNLKEFRGFGFWIRKANLLKLKTSRRDINFRVGRGVTLHIAPSNIAANILYTFAFGILSGCPSIIRISQKNTEDITSVLNLINEIMKLKEFKKLSKKYSFISYSHESDISSNLSSKVDARIIWGGNKTIQLFKSIKTCSHCIDLVFPDKVSSSILSLDWLINSEKVELQKKADLYARDIGLFSQMACSSPSTLILLKESKIKNENLLLEFFRKCDSSLSNKEWLNESHSYSNFQSSVEISMQFPNLNCFFKGKNLSVFEANKNQFKDFKNFKPKDCCLFIFEVDSINEIINFLPRNNQTIVCIGLKEDIKEKLAKKAMLCGTNRLVNPGNALNMDIFWDGYDIVTFLSKFISLN